MFWLLDCFIIGAIVGAVIIVLMVISYKKDERDRIKKLKEENYINNALSVLSEKGMNCDKIINLRRMIHYSSYEVYSIIVDDKNKKVAFVDAMNASCYITSFSKIMSYEIIKNGTEKVSGSVGSSMIGGMLFGATGAIIGSSRSKSVEEELTDLKLIVRINDIIKNEIIFSFVDATLNPSKVQSSSHDLIFIWDDIEKAKSILEYVLHNKKISKKI